MGLFHGLLQQALDAFLPLHRVISKRSKRPTPWFTDTIVDKIKNKCIAKRKADKYNDPLDKEGFRRQKNELKGMVQQAKVDYLQSLVLESKKSPQKASYMWSCVNNIIGRIKTKKDMVCDLLTLDSLNKHFQTVAVTSLHQSADTFAVPANSCDTDRFTFAEISESLVLSHLNSLDVKKSTGPDGLSAKFLKEIADVIAAPLATLFNCSLQSGVVPAVCKRSNITAVHKGGALDDPGNFRPISVVSVLAKVLEKIVSVQLGTFLERNNVLDPHQGAYRMGKSTEDILLLAVDNIVNSLDSEGAVCVAFLDFRKAFDSLDHCILLQRLYDVNVSSSVIMWFKSY